MRNKWNTWWRQRNSRTSSWACSGTRRHGRSILTGGRLRRRVPPRVSGINSHRNIRVLRVTAIRLYRLANVNGIRVRGPRLQALRVRRLQVQLGRPHRHRQLQGPRGTTRQKATPIHIQGANFTLVVVASQAALVVFLRRVVLLQIMVVRFRRQHIHGQTIIHVVVAHLAILLLLLLLLQLQGHPAIRRVQVVRMMVRRAVRALGLLE